MSETNSAPEDAEMQSAVTPDSSESRTAEVPTVDKLTVFQVDDMPELHAARRGDMESWGCPAECEIGNATSMMGALKKLTTLAEEGVAPDVILLDQQFLMYEDDEMTSEMASEFLRRFQKMREDGTVGPVVAKTKIVMVSGTDDDEFLKEMQAICPAVVGRAPKDDDTGERILSVLADEGVVQQNDRTKLAQRNVIHEKFDITAALDKGSFNGLKAEVAERVSGPLTSDGAMALLGAINDLRNQVGEEPFGLESEGFIALVSKLTQGRWAQAINTYVGNDAILASV